MKSARRIFWEFDRILDGFFVAVSVNLLEWIARTDLEPAGASSLEERALVNDKFVDFDNSAILELECQIAKLRLAIDAMVTG